MLFSERLFDDNMSPEQCSLIYFQINALRSVSDWPRAPTSSHQLDNLFSCYAFNFCRREQPFTLHINRQFHVTIEEMLQYRREET